MSRKKRTIQRGMVSRNIRRRKRETSSYGYLKLPKNVRLINIDDDVNEIFMDFLTYEVTDKNHPDAVDGATVGMDFWRRPYKVHRNVGVDSDTVVCPTSIGKPCPICEYMTQLRKEGKEWDVIKEFKPSERALYPVIPIDLPKHEEKVYVWDMSDFIFYKELEDYLEKNPEDRDFYLFDEGKTMRIRLKWKELGSNKFFETIILSCEDREAYDESILDETPAIDDLLEIMSYKDLEAKFLQLTDEEKPEEEPEEEEEEAKPARKPKTQRGRPRKKEEKEEKEELEDDDIDEELPEAEDTKKPARKPRSKPTPKKEQDEENPCPHGYVFGVDTDKYKECSTCTEWDLCIDEKDRLEAQE